MKAVILCGGKGSRLLEMTEVLPKPMLPVGDKPLLGHIIDIYRHYGVNDFILPMGYKREHILAYLMALNPSSMSISHPEGDAHFSFGDYEVTAINTGMETQTGGRLLRVKEYLHEPFHFTYGDGLSDVDLMELEYQYHDWGGTSVITLVHPEGRFGRATIDGRGFITAFGEKIETSDWINGGFSILHPSILKYIDNDTCNLEKEVYPQLAIEDGLTGYRHEGFWKCVDTKRDLLELDEIYRQEGAIWLKHS